MKKTLAILLTVLVCVTCFAKGNKEPQVVNMAVMQGPTGFSSVMIGDSVNISVYPSPNEAVSKLVNGELDFAVLPDNTADTLISKGIAIHKIAVVGQGMLSVVGTNPSAKELSVPGAGGTPDQMANLLYPQYKKDYSVTAPAQLSQLVIAGKVELAILPQPFVYMVMSNNSNVKVISNVQEEYKKQTGNEQYAMSVLVVRDDFAKANSKLVSQVKKDYKASVEKVTANPHEAALKIENLGIMAAGMAEPTIPLCALTFIDIE